MELDFSAGQSAVNGRISSIYSEKKCRPEALLEPLQVDDRRYHWCSLGIHHWDSNKVSLLQGVTPMNFHFLGVLASDQPGG